MWTKYRILCTFVFLTVLVSGCVGPKEACKGFLGVSTKILEDGRQNALKKEFSCDLITCHNKVRAILKENKSYIYADNLEKDMLALYISEEDTTPVGIFLTDIDKGRTLVEITSPSIYGKELIAKIVFTGLTASLTAKPEKGQINATKKEEVGK
ncbi:MAG: hypothetical protein PHV58_01270 [Candidatus Omnitrophica bacterium]|nr:hypothetical protein [Candidatus Omnitrophota bacterium]MDD5662251.1 hypothetical protein [Candidatus Omnitrophota bacterium]